jgi:hypothetical protein
MVRNGLQLWQIASGRFVLVPADRPLERARKLIDLFPRSYVVVQGDGDAEKIYWLLTPLEARSLPERPGARIGDALSVALPVPALDAALDVEEAPDCCVVLDRGEPIGIFHPEQDIPDIQRGAGEGGREIVSRMLVAKFARRVLPGHTLPLFLSLAISPMNNLDSLPLELPVGSVIDLYVDQTEGFELIGEREASLQVSREPQTLPARFQFRATRPGPGRIEILAFHGTCCLGRLPLAPVVGEIPETLETVTCYEALLAEPGPVPDLTLVIRETGERFRPELQIDLMTNLPEAEKLAFGPIRLTLDPLEFIADFFRDMESFEGRDQCSRERALQRLAARGAGLFESVFPEALRNLLWSHRKQIRTLRVESQEPWIPWELCRLTGKVETDSEIEGGAFFCEQFAMTRWLLGVAGQRELALKRIGLIAPAGSGLPAARAERRDRLGITEEDRLVEPIASRYQEVIKALATGLYDGLHFAGHGVFTGTDPNRSWIELDDGELTPWDLSGETANLGRSHPLVFFNACEAGRSAFSLTGMGGWAPRFLNAGASAFVAPYWSVRDKAAGVFSMAFYRNLLTGEPIGEAVRKARLEVREKFPGNPTWLAYTVFADPLARVAPSIRPAIPQITKPAQ